MYVENVWFTWIRQSWQLGFVLRISMQILKKIVGLVHSIFEIETCKKSKFLQWLYITYFLIFFFTYQIIETPRELFCIYLLLGVSVRGALDQNSLYGVVSMAVVRNFSRNYMVALKRAVLTVTSCSSTSSDIWNNNWNIQYSGLFYVGTFTKVYLDQSAHKIRVRKT